MQSAASFPADRDGNRSILGLLHEPGQCMRRTAALAELDRETHSLIFPGERRVWSGTHGSGSRPALRHHFLAQVGSAGSRGCAPRASRPVLAAGRHGGIRRGSAALSTGVPGGVRCRMADAARQGDRVDRPAAGQGGAVYRYRPPVDHQWSAVTGGGRLCGPRSRLQPLHQYDSDSPAVAQPGRARRGPLRVAHLSGAYRSSPWFRPTLGRGSRATTTSHSAATS